MLKVGVEPKTAEQAAATAKFLIRARLAKCCDAARVELEMLRSLVDLARPAIEDAGFRAMLSNADAIRAETDDAVNDVVRAWLDANGMEQSTER